jgi:hypothetical protein
MAALLSYMNQAGLQIALSSTTASRPENRPPAQGSADRYVYDWSLNDAG